MEDANARGGAQAEVARSLENYVQERNLSIKVIASRFYANQAHGQTKHSIEVSSASDGYPSVCAPPRHLSTTKGPFPLAKPR